MNLNVLLEGGAAGHMNHLYDNGDLSFKQMKEIFALAASGKLEGTEKTDGQNLMVSYSIQDGRAKGVRNKTEIKDGGLTPEQLASKFADRANPALKETFKDALSAFEKAIDGLSHKEQIELFGPDTSIYYNAEVMDPRTPNVINYDTKALVIHKTGHVKYDRKTGEQLDVDISTKSARLEEIIKSSQERMKDEEYSVQVNAIKRLKALSNQEPLNIAKSSINRILSAVNYMIANKELLLTDDSTVFDFMLARVYILISSILQKEYTSIGTISSTVKKAITKRILGVEGINANDIYKKVTPEQKQFIRANLLNKQAMSSLLSTAIHPLEMIVSNFATEMLRGLQSVFVLDNTAEIKRVQKEVAGAIKAIQSSENEEAMRILSQQLKKLKSAENITAAAEGFVFDYDGVTYKFTGNFAPVNQILGLFKYGRGKIPPMKKDELETVKENKKIKKSADLADVAVVPGAFKPPHKGHLDMIKNYSTMAKRVMVLVSPLPRSLPDGRIVTFEQSKEIFEMFLSEMGIDNVKVVESPKNSPVAASFDFLANQENNPDFAQEGEVVVLGTSTKGGDESRFKTDATKYAKTGVTVRIVPVEPFENLSATDMRAAIANSDIKKLTTFIPDDFGKKKKEIAEHILSMFGESEISESVIYDIIRESIEKSRDEYCLVSKRSRKKLGCYKSIAAAEKREKQIQYFKNVKEMSSAAGGAVQGTPIKKDKE